MNLSNQVAVLEQEKERLSRLVDTLTEELETLKQNPPVGERENHLIDLVEPDILWQEQNIEKMAGKKQERMKEIITAYRAIRPKEGEANAD